MVVLPAVPLVVDTPMHQKCFMFLQQVLQPVAADAEVVLLVVAIVAEVAAEVVRLVVAVGVEVAEVHEFISIHKLISLFPS